MLSVNNVHKHYGKTGTFFGKKGQAILSGVSFTVKAGQCMGLVGESGSGKSTLSRLVLGLESSCRGEILMEGKPVSLWRKEHPGQMSVVFQDYTTSVNPGFTVAQAIAEPLGGRQDQKTAACIEALLDRVALPKTVLHRRPHELSGGQVQRVCIARAIATRPRFILFDEALSSLDVPVQAQVLELLADLKQDLKLTYFFIAHDLLAVAALCDRVLFLHRGKIVEAVDTRHLNRVENQYARALLESAHAFASLKPVIP